MLPSKFLAGITAGLIFLANLSYAAFPGDSLIWTGVKSWYNYDTGQAVSILDSARKIFPEHPSVHLSYAAARYQHSQAVDPVEENYRVLDSDLSEIIPVYKNLIVLHPEMPEYKLYHGSAVGLKARIHLGRKQWIRTLLSAYKGFSIIRKVAADNPQLVDAQLPIGIVEYYAGLNGGLLELGAGLMGLTPSMDRGRAAILDAADNGDFSWMEAKGVLIYLYLYIDNDPHNALRHAEKLVSTFPKNWYFRQLLTHCQLATGDVVNGYKTLVWLDEHFSQLPGPQKETFYGYLHYEWGYYYFNQGNIELSLKSLSNAIDNYGAELDVILSEALLLKGQILDIHGQRSEAIKLYRKVVKLDNFSHSIKLAEKYLEEPFSD